MKNDVVVAADLGASKVVVAVGRRHDHAVELLGVASVDSRGLRRSGGVDADDMARCLAMAIEEAEIGTGQEIGSIDVAMRPTQPRGRTQEIRTELRSGVVTNQDVRNLEGRLGQAREGLVALYRSPLGYRVDDELVEDAPVGRSARRLARREYTIWSSDRSVELAQRCAGAVRVARVAPGNVATAWGVTTPEQRQSGVVVVEQGAGSTSVTVVYRGAVLHCAVIPLGGEDLTRNVAVSLQTSWDVAEAVKVHHAQATVRGGDTSVEISIPGVDGRPMQRRPRALLAQIIEPRLIEVLQQARAEIESVGGVAAFEVVVTGGSAMMPGFVDVAEQVFGTGVTLGLPRGCDGRVDGVRHPRYATVVGLLHLSARESESIRCYGLEPRGGNPRLVTELMKFLRRAF